METKVQAALLAAGDAPKNRASSPKSRDSRPRLASTGCELSGAERNCPAADAVLRS
jgi:hypothetical protein